MLRALRYRDLQRAVLCRLRCPTLRRVNNGVGRANGVAAHVARLGLQRNIDGCTRLHRARGVVGRGKLLHWDGANKQGRILVNLAASINNAEHLGRVVGLMRRILGSFARLSKQLYVNLGGLLVVISAGCALGKGDKDLARGIHTHLGALDLLTSDGDVAGQACVVRRSTVGNGDAGVVFLTVRNNRLGLLLRWRERQTIIRLNRPRRDIDHSLRAHTRPLVRPDRWRGDLPGPRLRPRRGWVHTKRPVSDLLLPLGQGELIRLHRRQIGDVQNRIFAAIERAGIVAALTAHFYGIVVRRRLQRLIFHGDIRLRGFKNALTLRVQGDPRSELGVASVQTNANRHAALRLRKGTSWRHRGGVDRQHHGALPLLRVRYPPRRADELRR